jgi:D-inositol-3-phosphate glycosyltransferase
MKILHLLLAESFGGLELYVCTLIKEQLKSGMQVVAYILPNTRVDRELANLGIRIIYGKPPKRLDFQAIFNIRKLMTEEKIDIIHSHKRLDVWIASLAVIGRKIPHVHSTYMSVSMRKKGLQYQLIYGQVARMISTSELTNQHIAANLPISPDKIRLIPYGRELNQYQLEKEKRTDIRRKHGLRDGQWVVGMLCRIDVMKGVKEFVESYLLLPQEIRQKMVYWIIGEPSIARSSGETLVYEQQSLDLEKWIADFVKEHQLEKHIIRIGFQKDYIPYLGCMDIFVLASYREMYSLTLVEAMLMKVPVIGTDAEGTPEQVKHRERGLLVPPCQAEPIAEAVLQLIDNKSLRDNCVQNAYTWVTDRHDLRKTIERYWKVYEEVAPHKSRIEKKQKTD